MPILFLRTSLLFSEGFQASPLSDQVRTLGARFFSTVGSPEVEEDLMQLAMWRIDRVVR